MSDALGWAGLVLGMISSAPLIFSGIMKDHGDPRWKWAATLGAGMFTTAIVLICISVIGGQNE